MIVNEFFAWKLVLQFCVRELHRLWGNYKGCVLQKCACFVQVPNIWKRREIEIEYLILDVSNLPFFTRISE